MSANLSNPMITSLTNNNVARFNKIMEHALNCEAHVYNSFVVNLCISLVVEHKIPLKAMVPYFYNPGKRVTMLKLVKENEVLTVINNNYTIKVKNYLNLPM